jgi:membrane protease YdiL (CAAX protease family)
MNDRQEKRAAWQKIATFVVAVMVLNCVAVYALQGSHLPPRLEFTIIMWGPALCAVAVKLLFDRRLSGLGQSLGLTRAGGRWLLVALLLPLAYALPVYLFAWIGGFGGFSPSRWSAAVPYIAAPGNVASSLALLLTFGLLDKLSRALGEEIGWRGFLVPECLKVMPFARAGLFSGTIWALWHVPGILYAGYNAGDIPLGYQFACFFVMVIASGVFFAWLRVATNSVWPCALLHAAHNLFIQSIFDQATVNGPNTLYVTGEFGAGLALTAAATALIVLAIRRRGEPNPV